MVHYNIFMAEHAKRRDWKGARGVWEQMHAVGLKPNSVTYTTIMTAYGTAGQWRPAEAVMQVCDVTVMRSSIRVRYFQRWPLNDAQRPRFRDVHVALRTGGNLVRGVGRPSRNGRVSCSSSNSHGPSHCSSTEEVRPSHRSSTEQRCGVPCRRCEPRVCATRPSASLRSTPWRVRTVRAGSGPKRRPPWLPCGLRVSSPLATRTTRSSFRTVLVGSGAAR